ncbi:MAG: azurin [Gammaproteobacteria bacterium TMED78]|nr:MAG: azurin [Gammaproteobacteria bacterium TMED78]|tara:strand:+ start:539 stop:988 length:450 start_codon:yes stop_codon:yes gene_type:complete
MRKIFAILILAGSFLGQNSWAQDCNQVIEGNDLLQFNLSEITVSSSCEEVTITLKHVGALPANVMGHNWVLTKTTDYMPVASAGQAFGPPGYLDTSDERIIGATPGMIGGGEEASITFNLTSLEVGGDYTFFCSFPGHYVLMNGKFIIQ